MPPDAPQPGFGGPFFYGGMHHGLGLRGGLFLVFLAILLIVAIAALLLSMSRRRDESSRGVDDRRDPTIPSNALGILDERLARGDIDVDEYRNRRNVLSSQA